MNKHFLIILCLLSVTAQNVRSASLKDRCIEMLYKYMPVADSANYTRDFFEHNVDMSLRAREEMPWGNIVPEKEFMHFVVPVRVNNEALDNHREVFYNELKDRVKGLGMKEAILEINHWCHEKVTYQPSDARTHSPLQSVSSAIGRCGEESTFGVAALRAMGIPARQVYTPRWAHTDDNHAWVEAWADGKWYFLGACEPEPVLNLGWFNAPAARGMLMHARVFGPYSGAEEILSTADGITDINVTDHYAPVDTIRVFVTDPEGSPIENAKVSFRIYNYAEFYPIATKTTDSNGHASLVAGLGDMLVWATDGRTYSFGKYHVGTDKNVRLVLDPRAKINTSMDIDIIPPVESKAVVDVSPELTAENEKAKIREDSIRKNYESTFCKAIPGDSKSELLARSRGNHRVIREFLNRYRNDENKAIALLNSLSEKDLTDVTMEVLSDFMSAEDNGSPLFAQYIMSPRIASEPLTAFRSRLSAEIPANLQNEYRNNPALWASWVSENIDASLDWYPSSVTMNPVEVWKVRRTSPLSRDIFFVAGARSIGIPARLDPVTSKPQWADKECNWHDAMLTEESVGTASGKHSLTLTYEPNTTVDDPLYYSHFTLSRIDKGEPQLQSYPDFEPWSKNFKNPQILDAGQYMLVTGQRLANGGVLSHIEFIDLTESDATAELKMRSDSSQVQVIGSFDSESVFTPAESDASQSILATTGRGYFVVGIVQPGHEPSNHILRDMAALKDRLEENGTPIIMLAADKDKMKKLDTELTSALPATTTLGYDSTGKISAALSQLSESQNGPVIIIADTFNRVVFVSSGYTIGIGQKLLDTLNRIK